MEYAVIRTGGKQYRVAPGDLIRVEKLPGDPGVEIAFDEVLMASTGGTIHLGKPMLNGAKVTGKVVLQGKAKKILVYKKKKRKNYRRHRGHRQLFTDVQVIGIEMGA